MIVKQAVLLAPGHRAFRPSQSFRSSDINLNLLADTVAGPRRQLHRSSLLSPCGHLFHLYKVVLNLPAYNNITISYCQIKPLNYFNIAKSATTSALLIKPKIQHTGPYYDKIPYKKNFFKGWLSCLNQGSADG